MRVRGVLLMVGLVAGSAAACTLWVDNQFKGYTSSCQLPNANDNVCGQCGTAHCQGLINTTCGQGSVTDDLNSCFADPSYPQDQTNWFCQNYFDDAALNDPSLEPDAAALRHCIHDHCGTECSTCTDFEAGTGECGDCLRDACAPIMNGIGGCCTDPDIATGMAACGSSVNHSCSAFLDYEGGFDEAGPPEAGQPGFCIYAFSTCVQANCGPACSK
jgi:hypothetical protein